MLPVRSSEPATTTRISPSAKTAPVKSVGSVPQVSSSRPEETVIARRLAKAMYAPARKAPTSNRSGLMVAFWTPLSVLASVIWAGSL